MPKQMTAKQLLAYAEHLRRQTDRINNHWRGGKP